jgi:hypothetical protein
MVYLPAIQRSSTVNNTMPIATYVAAALVLDRSIHYCRANMPPSLISGKAGCV